MRPLPFSILSATAVLVLCFGGGRAEALHAAEGQKQPQPGAGAVGPGPRKKEVVFHSGAVRLAGTLLLPRANKLVPAVVFVHGAAYHDRKDNWEEAEYFARRGIAALIYDKRGCGASTGDWTAASQFDLAEDALAAVRLLKDRPEIDTGHIGLWGMSQGASIIPLTAVRSPDVAFLIAVSGCLSFDRQMYYYRANLFRQRELPDSLLDIANKASLVANDFARRVRNGLPVPAAWRARCAFDVYLDYHREWARVRQPVLAVYGALDQAVPVSESAAGLREALQRGGNEDWTILIYPGAGHTLGRTEAGELYEPWRGYVPGFLEDVTEWVLRRAAGGKLPGGRFKGNARESVLPYPAEYYERSSWYGNSLVQLALVLGFFLIFAAGTLSWPAGLLFHRLYPPAAAVAGPSRTMRGMARALCIVNLVLLAGLLLLVQAVGDPVRPAYPTALRFLPLGGSLSAVLTLLLLALLARAWCAGGWTRGRRWWWAVVTVAGACFVPFLLYWDLLGTQF